MQYARIAGQQLKRIHAHFDPLSHLPDRFYIFLLVSSLSILFISFFFGYFRVLAFPPHFESHQRLIGFSIGLLCRQEESLSKQGKGKGEARGAGWSIEMLSAQASPVVERQTGVHLETVQIDTAG